MDVGLAATVNFEVRIALQSARRMENLHLLSIIGCSKGRIGGEYLHIPVRIYGLIKA